MRGRTGRRLQRTGHGHIERAGRGAGPRRRGVGRGEGVAAGRQSRCGVAPGAAAARGRGAERRRATIRHRHRRSGRCGARQGHRLVGIGHAGADDRSRRRWRRPGRCSARQGRRLVGIGYASADDRSRRRWRRHRSGRRCGRNAIWDRANRRKIAPADHIGVIVSGNRSVVWSIRAVVLPGKEPGRRIFGGTPCGVPSRINIIVCNRRRSVQPRIVEDYAVVNASTGFSRLIYNEGVV